MDVVAATVLCSSGAAPSAGAVLAPIVASLPAPHHQAHEPHSANPVSHAACANGTHTANISKHGVAAMAFQHAPPLTPVAEEESNPDPSALTSSHLWTQSVFRSHSGHHHHPHQQPLSQSKLAIEAISVLRANDLGGYTIPATGLYPYQWNWDSALVAMGWSAVDEPRAWEELEKLFSAQWEDGMVPHIVFHKASPTYFPGPEIWGYADRPMKSTGITQPPIAATSVRRILENQLLGGPCALSVRSGETGDDWDSFRPAGLGAGAVCLEFGSDFETSSTCSTSYCKSPSVSAGGVDELEAESWAKAAEIFPKLMRYHRWFFSARDPENTGLVATLHPWESGMDNSPAWDVPLANVPVDNIPPYTRRDLGHVDAAMRPHQSEYDRYLTLLYRFRGVDYDPEQLYWLSPFRVSDVCTNSLLHRANLDLRWLAISLNRLDCVAEIDSWLERSGSAFDSLWDEERGIFMSKDQLTGKLLDASTSGGFLPLFARVATPEQAARLASTMESWLEEVEYGVPSLDPRDARFEGLRYWRGPVWAIANYMIVDGLRFYGYNDLANRIEQDTLALVHKSGLYEYYEPTTGKGAGGNNFSWTAAMVLSWLEKSSGAGGDGTPESVRSMGGNSSPALVAAPAPNVSTSLAGAFLN